MYPVKCHHGGLGAIMMYNRRASLFSSVGQMSPNMTHESNFRPIPIKEIKRWFGLIWGRNDRPVGGLVMPGLVA
jgi:hypothetical protein